MSARCLDLSGQKFGRLLVIKRAGSDSSNNALFECVCDCGKVVVKRATNLRLANIKSCGCYRKERGIKMIERFTTHGHCTKGISATYYSWSSMWTRCTYKNHPSYHRYGGRGIVICERWRRFDLFLEDMGQRPTGMTLDRKDGDGNYCKENCQWATRKSQCRHRVSNLMFTVNGVTACLSELVESHNVKYTTAKERLVRGWTIERALGL